LVGGILTVRGHFEDQGIEGKNNIKMHRTEIGWEGVERLCLVKETDN
jgi:hypothetical protein